MKHLNFVINRNFNLIKRISMTTMTLQVPDALEKEHDETVRFLAAKLYEAGKLSLGQAAEMCGMKKWDFPEVLVKYDIPYFQQTAQEVFNEANSIK
jgi:predicted HTH domain antitoxin